MRRAILILMLLALLTACGGGAPPPTPTAAPTAPPTATPTTVPTTTPTASPTTTPTTVPTAAPLDLQATVEAELPPTPTIAPGEMALYTGIVSATVRPLTGEGAGRFLVATAGIRSFEPPQNHFVAVYEPDGARWRELSRLELENPDYLDEGGVAQVEIAPGRVWLAVDSGVGAHGGCFDLLSFDGSRLTNEVTHCNSSPGAGGVADLDGDGVAEILLNQTDNYVSCYACGLRDYHTAALRWDGSTFDELSLVDLPSDTALARLNNQAVALARAGLWVHALPLVAELRAAGAGDQVALTNAALIELDGQAFADQAGEEGLTPLMPRIFYGDYAGAISYLRDYQPAQLFSPEGSRVFGPEVEGFESAMPAYITTTTELALTYAPDLAPAHFLHGWALLLADPTSVAGLAEIEEAARLDPQELLYAACLSYLRSR